MKRLLLTLLLVASTAQAHLTPEPELIAEIATRTFLVVTDESLGNGIMIKNGKLLTMAHFSGTRFVVQTYPRKLLRTSILYDLTILEMKGVKGETPLGDEPQVGQMLFTLGYNPGLKGQSLQSGQVMQVDGKVIYVDMPVYPGNSGQGVYDAGGNLVGLVEGIALLCEYYCRPIAIVLNVEIIKVFLSQGE